jgi:hypothetical protein
MAQAASSGIVRSFPRFASELRLLAPNPSKTAQLGITSSHTLGQAEDRTIASRHEPLPQAIGLNIVSDTQLTLDLLSVGDLSRGSLAILCLPFLFVRG